METTITLSAEDCEKFKQFQKYYVPFCILLESGVFNHKSAGITLNFDHRGDLLNIERHDKIYNNRFGR